MNEMNKSVNENYPKVLIVNSQSMLANNATGITLRSLWGFWPKDRFLEIYEDERECCVDPFFITRIKLPDNDFLLKKFMCGFVGNRINSSLKKGVSYAGNVRRLSIKNKIRQAFVSLWNMSPTRIDKDTMCAIKKFSPDVIYTLGSTVTILNLCSKLAQKFNIRVVIHYMDNWTEHLQWDDNILLLPYKCALKASLKNVLRHSKVGIVISDSMADRYNRTLGMNHTVLMNSINANNYYTKYKVHQKKKVFVYAGGLHLNRWKALIDIARCIDNEMGILKIYTNDENRNNYEKMFVGLPVEFCDMVNHDQIIQIYEKADILVHTETADPLMQGFFKYSISTKIPEYLASGRIVLFYGPKNLGLYHYLNDNQVSICVSDRFELKEVIDKICINDIDENMTTRAYALVERNHDIGQAREKLRKTLISGI